MPPPSPVPSPAGVAAAASYPGPNTTDIRLGSLLLRIIRLWLASLSFGTGKLSSHPSADPVRTSSRRQPAPIAAPLTVSAANSTGSHHALATVPPLAPLGEAAATANLGTCTSTAAACCAGFRRSSSHTGALKNSRSSASVMRRMCTSAAPPAMPSTGVVLGLRIRPSPRAARPWPCAKGCSSRSSVANRGLRRALPALRMPGA
jgi:hypothetical protein